MKLGVIFFIALFFFLAPLRAELSPECVVPTNVRDEPSLEKQYENFLQRILTLKSAVLAFEEKYINIPELACSQCGKTINTGGMYGALLGYSIKDPTHKNIENLSVMADQMIQAFENTVFEVVSCALDVANQLAIVCPYCDSHTWQAVGIYSSGLLSK